MKFLERTPPKNDKNGPLAETEQDRKSSRIIYKRTREEIGMGEPNDSPEIPDRGKISDNPNLHDGRPSANTGVQTPYPSQCCELSHDTRRQQKKEGHRNKPEQLSLLAVQYHSVCSTPLQSATPSHSPVLHLKHHSALTWPHLNSQWTENSKRVVRVTLNKIQQW